MHVFLVKLSVVHVRLLHDLEEATNTSCVKAGKASNGLPLPAVHTVPSDLHAACDARLLAVAVVEERYMALSHVPHEVACLEVINRSHVQ